MNFRERKPSKGQPLSKPKMENSICKIKITGATQMNLRGRKTNSKEQGFSKPEMRSSHFQLQTRHHKHAGPANR
jgi:hypothetical protein